MADKKAAGEAKFSAVALNSIWIERINKENTHYNLNEDFRVNPYSCTCAFFLNI